MKFKTALFFLFFGLVMLALLIFSWETDRIFALSLLTGGFLSVGIILALVVLRSLKTMPKLFEATITELSKDRQELAKR